MIICCYADLPERWSEKEFAAKLNLLPPELKYKALQKKLLHGRQLFIAGKLLLLQLLNKFNLGEIFLEELKYNAFGRPYFDATIDFNISHSGSRIVCCGTLTGMIGIDVEFIKSINPGDYSDYFTQKEWKQINKADNQTAEFYNYWTRKEAVLKAIGNGFDFPLSEIDVSGDSLVYDRTTYYLMPQVMDENYKCTIAATAEGQNIQWIPVTL